MPGVIKLIGAKPANIERAWKAVNDSSLWYTPRWLGSTRVHTEVRVVKSPVGKLLKAVVSYP